MERLFHKFAKAIQEVVKELVVVQYPEFVYIYNRERCTAGQDS